MTLEDTRREPREGARRSTGVVRPDEAQPLGNIGGRLRNGLGNWLKSPALDFYGLLVVGALLVSVGLVMVLSSSSVSNISRGASGFDGFIRQGTFAVMGMAALVTAALLPPGFYRRAAWILFGIGLLLQLLVHVPGLGVEVYGNRNWIQIGSQRLQPSEFLKLALAVWLGAVLAMKRPLLTKPFHLFIPLVPGAAVALGLVMSGKDLGTMLVMAMLVAGAVWVAGVPRRWFMAAGALGAVGVLVLTVTSGNRMARINNWIHGTCPGDSCLQSDQSLMGLAEGGWWGVGLGQSRQKWGRLPAAEDDYIFAIIGEELGLIGTLGVLLLFAALALIMLRMITRLDDHFMQITVAGISAWLLGQAFVNMMVVTGLLPVIGVPLPFISSGGSALLASMTALGLLISFARCEPGAQEAIGARLSSVRRSIGVLPAPRERRAAAPAEAEGTSRARSSSTRSGTGSGSPAPKRASSSSKRASRAVKRSTARSSSSRSRRSGRGSAPSSRRS